MRAVSMGRARSAGKRMGWQLGGVALAALALSGCVSMRGERLAPGEEPVLMGPAVRDNRTHGIATPAARSSAGAPTRGGTSFDDMPDDCPF